ncbi:helix-turn-helix domain protein [Ralstonia insidiosa]|uniref:Helix-turn-helix domain protein n=1 Tax=Ralstonia insidiosa TaxID=190721 RepID=A0AAC9BK56_9RALS|nr:helix-turn-helix domain protein [Ralstonia insidiosa]MBY4705512.1 helix-turn-helix domain-containing protein [Ralstonia insidiosa]GAQ29641.1 araC family transcriptional regulator [Ralstonia sp. NT80]
MSTALNDDALHTAPTLSRLLLPPAPPTLAPGIVHSDFSVQGDARQSFLAWQERMSPVYDIRPPSKQADDTFNASLSRYTIDNLSLFDFHTGPNLAVRSLGRVSTESVRDVTFSIFLAGPPSQFQGGKPRADAAHIPRVPSILALDMDQPCTIRSFEGRLLLLFVPRALVEQSFPDAASLHGRWVHATTPLTRLLIEHVVALRQQIVGLSKEAAQRAFLTAVELILAAYGRQAGLAGNARAAVRAAVYGKVRRHVESNLRDPNLSPESVLASLHFSRASVYRIFEHDGGLAAYIRSRRLRMAADELVRFPQRGIQDVASGLGFNDASSFTRAFRRAFDIAPRELHEYAPLLQHGHAKRERFT